MKIGVVCSDEGRFDFFRRLLYRHCVVRIPLERVEHTEDLSILDGVFVHVPDLSQPPNLLQIMQQHGFVFAAHEETPPCIVRQCENGAVHLQCGQQAAAKLRAAQGTPSRGTSTLVFQQTETGENSVPAGQLVPMPGSVL